MVTTQIKQEWPTDAEIPPFRAHQVDENVQLYDFVKRLTEGKEPAEYTFPECAFGALAIREMVMGDMRERRRKRKDLDILKGQAALVESSNGDTKSVESESSSSGSSPPSDKNVYRLLSSRQVQCLSLNAFTLGNPL